MDLGNYLTSSEKWSQSSVFCERSADNEKQLQLKEAVLNQPIIEASSATKGGCSQPLAGAILNDKQYFTDNNH